MKFFQYLFVVFLSVIFFSQFSSATQPIKFAAENAGIGEIRTSLLKPADFNKIYGPDWSLLAPQVVTNLPISQFLDPSFADANGRLILPDARGKFLRMANNDASGANYDPNSRILGSYQGQAIPVQKHNHTTSFVSNGWPDDSGNRTKDKKPSYIVDPIKAHGNSKKKNYVTTTATLGAGAEIRPKNIAVNFYIRVNCKTGGKCEP